MKIAIVLVHNKSDSDNASQVDSLKLLTKEVTDGPFVNQDTGESWTTIHHELVGLNIPHQVTIFQVVPFGVTPSSNRYDINSGGIVYYESGDEDKVGDHPRFFNWAAKKGVNDGADIIVYLQNPNGLVGFDIGGALANLSNDKLAEEPWGKMVTKELLAAVGELKEDRGFSLSIQDYKERIIRMGIKNG